MSMKVKKKIMELIFLVTLVLRLGHANIGVWGQKITIYFSLTVAQICLGKGVGGQVTSKPKNVFT